jgi:hypothetical protein
MGIRGPHARPIKKSAETAALVETSGHSEAILGRTRANRLIAWNASAPIALLPHLDLTMACSFFWAFQQPRTANKILDQDSAKGETSRIINQPGAQHTWNGHRAAVP